MTTIFLKIFFWTIILGLSLFYEYSMKYRLKTTTQKFLSIIFLGRPRKISAAMTPKYVVSVPKKHGYTEKWLLFL